MFAPPIAKVQTKTAANASNKRVDHRTSLAQSVAFQRNSSDQAELRLFATRVSTPPMNLPEDEQAQEAVRMRTLGREAAPGLSWGFGKIPVFTRDQTNHLRAPIPLIAPLLPDALQPKLIVGQLNDPVEQAVDRVANQILHMPDPDRLINAAPRLRVREWTPNALGGTAPILTPSSKPAAGGPRSVVAEALGSSGQPLSAFVRTFFEPRFGTDFSNVRAHTNRHSTRSAALIGARLHSWIRHLLWPW
jgi:hypothetical protein